MSWQLDLTTLSAHDSTGLEGKPLSIAIELIDEDPEQPRVEFDADALQELASTIAERGVRQPVSVRPHPQRSGRWMLNFGARRLRASMLAGRTTIPAFVDALADDYDQVIENEQRAGLRPLELAIFVQRRLAAGDTQKEIARRMGKSASYVTYATALIDAPDWLMEIYRSGRCGGLRELHELRRLRTRSPESATEIESKDRSLITREKIASARRGLEGTRTARLAVAQSRESNSKSTPARPLRAAVAVIGPGTAGPGAETSAAEPRLRLFADLAGELVQVVLNAPPSKDGKVLVTDQRTGVSRHVPIVELGQLRLVIE